MIRDGGARGGAPSRLYLWNGGRQAAIVVGREHDAQADEPWGPGVTAVDWLTANGYLWARILAGVMVFAGLGLWDWRKNGRAATRWKEYLFLFAAAGVAVVYGALNDQLTSAISWEYFYYWKGLAEKFNDQVPPPTARLHWEAAKIGMQAAWSLGLVAGVALLVANNPSKRLPQARYGFLWRMLPIVIGITAGFSIVGGLVGHAGGLNGISADLLDEATRHRPDHFMATWGIHLGGYVGAPIGIAVAVWQVRRQRRRLAAQAVQRTSP